MGIFIKRRNKNMSEDIIKEKEFIKKYGEEIFNQALDDANYEKLKELLNLGVQFDKSIYNLAIRNYVTDNNNEEVALNIINLLEVFGFDFTREETLSWIKHSNIMHCGGSNKLIKKYIKHFKDDDIYEIIRDFLINKKYDSAIELINYLRNNRI